MITTLLFDFYGVFLPDSYGTWLAHNSLKREGIFAQLINDRDRGIITEPELLSELSSLLNREVGQDEIHIKNPEVNHALVKLIRTLKKQYTIGLLSNASPSLRNKLEAYKITDIFDAIIISGEIGHAKPSDQAYEIAIARLGKPAGDILFIDDNPDNIAAALKNNMQGCLFVSIDSLHEALGLIQEGSSE